MKYFLLQIILFCICQKAFTLDAYQNSSNTLVVLDYKTSVFSYYVNTSIFVDEIKRYKYSITFTPPLNDKLLNEVSENFQIKFSAFLIISGKYLFLLLPNDKIMNINYPKIKYGEGFNCILKSMKGGMGFPIYYGQYKNNKRDGKWVEYDNNWNRYFHEYKDGSLVIDTVDIFFRNYTIKTSYLPIIGRYLAFVVDKNPCIKSSYKDIRDGTFYKTVQIESQTWLAENLNFKTKKGSWCYDKSDSNCTTYGRLYNWENANIACPDGWHLPSYKDWDKLLNYLPRRSTSYIISNTNLWADKHMKSCNNMTGFSSIPGGIRDEHGYFKKKGYDCVFWTSDTDTSNIDYFVKDTLFRLTNGDKPLPLREYPFKLALTRKINNMNYYNYEYIECGLSVRCVKNE